jgi:hypothetical protein
MFNRIILAVGSVLAVACLLGSGTALASVKCQCNDGAISEAMDADFGDDNAEEACNDACSSMGGGRTTTRR